SVGLLEYYVSYKVIKAASATPFILGVPFFKSERFLEKAQINTLANILTVFGVLFLLLFAVTYFVARWLTHPLVVITNSLKKISLSNINTPVRWKSDDEFGLVVKEYNTMITKLAESKRQLELSQHEKAWREIAQQVAHEIKNPLTPMKLTVQQLERNIQQPLSPEKMRIALLTLENQLDILNGIATSFSAFAKMPEPRMDEVEIVSLIRQVADLFGQSGEVTLESSESNLIIAGDRELLKRIFSNLVLNGLQAERREVSIRVDIKVEAINNHCRISLKDNGRGIDKSLADKIFLPHFTTKETGSGLGLAIAKQGIEKMNGTIRFESEPDSGTLFMVEFPLKF
ncbi:MAG: ATP-binding protein, partial [Flammeovirgaceae bacterium]|nr:ATP-binding protein [Flammeovirgaceae bacterium]